MVQIKGDCLADSLIPVTPSQVSNGSCIGLSCSPQQSLPQPLNGITVSPDNVAWLPTSSASCMMNIGLTTLSDWMTWVEQNIIKSFCSVKSASCQIGVSQASAGGGVEVVGKTIGAALADCLGLTDALPHIVFDDATGEAVAGLIDTPAPDCEAFLGLLQDCPPLASEGEIPSIVIGYRENVAAAGGIEAKRYQVTTEVPTRFFGTIPLGDDNNRVTNVAADSRLTPKNMTTVTNDIGTDTGNAPTGNMGYTVGTAGFYDIKASVMINTVYTPRSGWIVTHMCGILHTKANGSVAEYRLDEKPLYLNYTASGGQDLTLTGSAGINLEAGDRVNIRVWHNDTTGSGLGRTITKWINRSATTGLSVIRRTDRAVTIQG